MRGIYVLTSDGYIHEQILATGLDYAPPVKYLPAPLAGDSYGLNMNEKVVYAMASSVVRPPPRMLGFALIDALLIRPLRGVPGAAFRVLIASPTPRKWESWRFASVTARPAF